MTRYVYHGGDGSAGTVFASGMAGAYSTFEAARAAASAGEDIAIASDHQETYASAYTGTFLASLNDPSAVYTINRTTGVYSAASAAAPNFISNTGINITWNGGIGLVAGVSFRIGGGVAVTSSATLTIGGSFGRTVIRDVFCELPNNIGGRFNVSGSEAYIENPRMKVGSTNGTIQAALGNGTHFKGDGSALWDNTGGGVIPAAINAPAANTQQSTWEGFDFLAHTGAGKALLTASSSANVQNTFINCALHTGAVIPVGTSYGHHGNALNIINCVDELGAIRNEVHRMSGASKSNYSIYRSGGANDGNPFSFLFQTTSVCNRLFPVRSLEVDLFVPASNVGVSTTFAFPLIYDAASVTLDNGDIWAILASMETASSVLSEIRRTGPGNPFDTTSALTADTSTWFGTGGMTTPTKRKLEFTFTPTKIGPHKVQICCGKAGAGATTLTTQVYVDPSPVITP